MDRLASSTIRRLVEAGLKPPYTEEALREWETALWDNSEIRNNFYSQCSFDEQPGTGLKGTLFWECGKNVASAAGHADDFYWMPHLSPWLEIHPRAQKLAHDVLEPERSLPRWLVNFRR